MKQWKTLVIVLRNEIPEIAKVIGLSETKIKTYLESLTEHKLGQYRMKSGNLINSLNGFPDNLVKVINEQLGSSDFTFEELVLAGVNLNLNKAFLIHFERFKQAYLAPLCYYPLLMEEFPHLFEKALKLNIKYIFELITFAGSSLSSLLEISESDARKVRYTLDFDKIKKYIKREAVPLSGENELLKLDINTIEKLALANITTIQGLMFPYPNLSNSDIKWILPLSKLALELFELPINKLEGLRLSSIPQLRRRGISNIGSFIVGSTKFLKSITKMKASQLTELRQNPKLATKSSLESSLDALLKK